MAQSTPITVRIDPASKAELGRVARRMGVTPSETGARLIEEGLRLERFPQIEFRNSSVGRQAYLKGTRLPVFFIVRVADQFKRDAKKTAEHFAHPRSLIDTALSYALSFPTEIQTAIGDYEILNDFERLRETLPGIELIKV